MLSQKKIDSLLKSGDWIIRFDNDGESYGGFKWKPKGQWTEAPDFNNEHECGGGLHGQSPMAAGYCQPGTRMVLAKIQGKKIAIGKDKIKVRKALILAVNEHIPAEFIIKLSKHGGSFDLRNYQHPLPAGLTSIGGYVDLSNYQHPLPAGLTSIGGDVDLSNYQHPLPAGLTINGHKIK